MNPKATGEKMAQICFEKFNIPAFYLAPSSVLALYASGLKTGIVVESGDAVTCVVPVCEASPIQYAVMSIPFAGRDLTENLMQTLPERSHWRSSYGQLEFIRGIKEKLCEVAVDFDKLMAKGSSVEKEYTLPDGQVIFTAFDF